MWIMSKDDKVLLNTKKIDAFYIEPYGIINYRIVANTSNDSWELGQYKFRSEAVDALNAIKNHMSSDDDKYYKVQ